MNATSLPEAAPRRLLHQRSVECDGYLRDDGLWEIEARLLDTKTYAYVHFMRGALAPGAAVHDMALRLTVDDQLTVKQIEAEMATTPMLACQDVRPRLQELIGIRLGPGWRKIARERVGRIHSCTHLMDLMVPAVTTLYQSMGMGKHPDGQDNLQETRAADERPFFLDGCYGWRADGPGVRQFLPQFAADAQKEGSPYDHK